MLSYYIVLHDFNTNKVVNHDIMPYLVGTYKECKENEIWPYCEDLSKEPITKEDFIYFVKRVLMNRYWSRCEYEWLMIPWPPGKADTLEDCQKILEAAIKIDAWEQLEPNLEVVVATFMANIKAL